jgi:hypothetical protein
MNGAISAGDGGRKHARQAPGGDAISAVYGRQVAREPVYGFTVSLKCGLEETRMTLHSIGRRQTRRTVWLVAALALVLVLALAACGGRGAGGNGGYNDGGSQGGSGGQSAGVTQVVQGDADLTTIMATLDSVNVDANIDESSLDNEMTP